MPSKRSEEDKIDDIATSCINMYANMKIFTVLNYLFCILKSLEYLVRKFYLYCMVPIVLMAYALYM